MDEKLKEGFERQKIWFAGGNATMCKQTWLNFKSKAWENKKKIRSLNQTICNNINRTNKEKFDTKTDIHNMKYEMNSIRDAHPETSKIF